MSTPEIPVGVRLEREVIGFNQIHHAFSTTDYGRKLADSTRYDRYKPQGVTNNEWEGILGVDVNNLKHLKLTYGLTRSFIGCSVNPPTSWQNEISAEAQFSLEEQEDLLLAATVHDWAEAVKGDKMFDLKTQSDEDKELVAFQGIINSLYGQPGGQELLHRINHVIDTVIKDRNTKLGRAFNAVERVGYLRTGLRAWQRSKDADGDMKTGLQWLTNNVLLNQIPRLVEYSKTYPAVYAYLKENEEMINDAFNSLPEAIFDKYTDQERKEKVMQFNTARQKWQLYLGGSN